MTEPLLHRLLTNFNKELVDELDKGRDTADHPTARGDSSELAWREMLEQYLPKRYAASSGFVVDASGDTSQQIDLIVYDRQYSPFIFQDRAKRYIPAESVYAIFEIKQALNKSHIEYAQEKAESVRKLKRTSLPVPNVYGTSKPKELHFIHAGLLCFNSDWSPPFGQPFEKALLAGTGEQAINQVCVAQNGYFEIDDEKQIYHGAQPVTYFFMRLVNMLQQKGTVPMIDIMAYAAWLDQQN
jgi:hypothetical protein